MRPAGEPGPAWSAHVADTTDAEGLAAAVALAEDRFGGLDAMIAVAGVIAGGVPLWEMPADQLGAVLGVDLGGPITAARVGIPALLRRPAPRQGRFLAVASAAATRGLPRLSRLRGGQGRAWPDWCAGLAAELAGTGITANAVSPGSTATAMLDESARLYGLADTGPFADQQPVGRLLAPEGGGRCAGLAGRCRQRRDDRSGDPGGRRPHPVTPLPEGFGLALDPSVAVRPPFRDGTVLVGGAPGRVIILSAEGRRALDGLLLEEWGGDGAGVGAPTAARCPYGKRPAVSDAGWSTPAWPTRTRPSPPGRGAPLGHGGGPGTRPARPPRPVPGLARDRRPGAWSSTTPRSGRTGWRWSAGNTGRG